MADVARLLSNAKYMFQDQTRRDVVNVLNQYRGLKPRLEKCTLPTGIKRELLVLKGTIPVTYRKNVYNIPVSLWILHNHPDSAPLCWVNPTKDMTIKVSRHVDDSGRIYLPYLADWTPQSSDLLGVIQVMIILFGETPPLYSKPKTTTSESSSTSTAYTPTSSNPNPPYPNPHYPGQSYYPSSNVYPAISPITSSSTPYPQTSEAPNTNSSYPFSMPNRPSMPNYAAPVTSASNTDTISKDHIRLSLISAVEDKVKARSKEIASQFNAEIDVLKKTGDDLNRGRIKLDTLVKTIETNLVELNKCKDKINNKNAKMDDYLNKMESCKDSLNIDEYFGPVQPLYKQLLNAFVEENSIVDTIYYLNMALQKGVIDIDIFIKHVRELSRRQFMMRALIKLCREKAGLPT